LGELTGLSSPNSFYGRGRNKRKGMKLELKRERAGERREKL